jgi:hypothetical protein
MDALPLARWPGWASAPEAGSTGAGGSARRRRRSSKHAATGAPAGREAARGWKARLGTSPRGPSASPRTWGDPLTCGDARAPSQRHSRGARGGRPQPPSAARNGRSAGREGRRREVVRGSAGSSRRRGVVSTSRGCPQQHGAIRGSRSGVMDNGAPRRDDGDCPRVSDAQQTRGAGHPTRNPPPEAGRRPAGGASRTGSPAGNRAARGIQARKTSEAHG